MDTEPIKRKTFLQAIAALVLLEAIHFLLAVQLKIASPLIILAVIRIFEVLVMLSIIRHQSENVLLLFVNLEKLKQRGQNGIIWSLLIAGISIFGAVLFHVLGFNVIQFIKETVFFSRENIILFFLIGCFISPIAEEIFFRGILFGFFRRWGFLTALVFSTFWFALLHPGVTSIPFIQITGGILFATIYEFEKNLLPSIIVHILGNFTLFSICLI